jgi:hypothetical protein
LLPHRRRRRSRLAVDLAGAREDELLVNETDADQRRAKAQEGQRAQHAFEAGEIEQEDLDHGRRDERGRGEPRRSGAGGDPIGKEQHAEAEPQRGVSVELTLSGEGE